MDVDEEEMEKRLLDFDLNYQQPASKPHKTKQDVLKIAEKVSTKKLKRI